VGAVSQSTRGRSGQLAHRPQRRLSMDLDRGRGLPARYRLCRGRSLATWRSWIAHRVRYWSAAMVTHQQSFGDATEVRGYLSDQTPRIEIPTVPFTKRDCADRCSEPIATTYRPPDGSQHDGHDRKTGANCGRPAHGTTCIRAAGAATFQDLIGQDLLADKPSRN
jgi:hypothetical protein